MRITSFDLQNLRPILSQLRAQKRACFATFWAQRLWPFYARFNERTGSGDPNFVQECLDVAWAAAIGTVSHDDVSRCQESLQELAPDIELPPLLGYAAMECTAATWDALAAAESGSIEDAMATIYGYQGVLRHFLYNRDHRGTRLASKDPDPLGLLADPIWQPELRALNQLLTSLSQPVELSAQSIDECKAGAANGRVKQLVDEMDELSREIQGAQPTGQTGQPWTAA